MRSVARTVRIFAETSIACVGSNFIVVVESIQTLISKKDDRQFHLPSIIAVASALGMSSPT